MTWHNNRLVHGPYTQETREDFLRHLLRVEKLVHEIGPDSIKDVPLISKEELKLIRQIWLDEFHEFEDRLPVIYEEETGIPYDDGSIGKNKYFGAQEATLIKEVCDDVCKGETLMPQMIKALLDVEAKAAAISNKRNVINNLEREIKKAFYRDEPEAEIIASSRATKLSEAIEEMDDEFVE